MLLKVFYKQTALARRCFSTSCIKRAKGIFDSTSKLKVLQPLQAHAPTFYTHGENITPLYQPSEFYSELKVELLTDFFSISV